MSMSVYLRASTDKGLSMGVEGLQVVCWFRYCVCPELFPLMLLHRHVGMSSSKLEPGIRWRESGDSSWNGCPC